LRWLARRSRRTGAIDFKLGGGRPFSAKVRGVTSGCLRILSAAPILGWVWILQRRIDAGAFRRFFRGVGFVEAALFGGLEEYRRKTGA